MTSAFMNDPNSLEAKAERFGQYHGIMRQAERTWLQAVEDDLALEIGRPNEYAHRQRVYRCGLWCRIVKRANA